MKFYNAIVIDKTSNNWQKLNQVSQSQSIKIKTETKWRHRHYRYAHFTIE